MCTVSIWRNATLSGALARTLRYSCAWYTMTGAAERRLAALREHLRSDTTKTLVEQAATEGLGSVSLADHGNERCEGDALSQEPTSASSGLQREIQLLLEHDSHAEREKLKELCRGELFTP